MAVFRAFQNRVSCLGLCGQYRQEWVVNNALRDDVICSTLGSSNTTGIRLVLALPARWFCAIINISSHQGAAAKCGDRISSIFLLLLMLIIMLSTIGVPAN